MSYLNTVTGTYPLSADDIKREHAGTSFPADVASFEIAISRIGYVKVTPVEPPAVHYTQNITEGPPAQSGNGYEQDWVISDATAAEVTERTADQAEQVRSERNRLLSECDWTQLPDAPVDAAAWAAYRQDLRDVTAQSGFPWEVTWPAIPA